MEPRCSLNQYDRGKRNGLRIPRSPLDLVGGAKGDRTPDLMTASHALSQLSYGPTRFGRAGNIAIRVILSNISVP